MTNSVSRTLDREELHTLLTGAGYKVDRWGHLQKQYGNGVDAPLREYRIKFQATSIRIEKRVRRSDGSREWLRIGGDYYKNIQLYKGCVLVRTLRMRVENETV